MIKRQAGFTIVELLITMVIFVITIAAASNIFTSLLGQFKQQSKIAETNIEGVIGLELLRFDIEQAGYGLPWDMNGGTYNNEAADDATTSWNDTALNDAPNGVPRAILTLNDVGLNTSDVISIKALTVSGGDASQRWTYISNRGNLPNVARLSWSTFGNDNNVAGTDYTMIINPSTSASQRLLINSGGAYAVQMNDAAFTFNGAVSASNYEPQVDSYTTYIAYVIKDSSGGVPRMPFNRADFYVKRPVSMPSQCEPNTGILYKATVNHSDGNLTELPLLDCVLDMQVVLAADTNGDGTADAWYDAWLGGTVASTIRSQLKGIRVYIVAHEGQEDTSYSYTNQAPTVGCANPDQICIIDPDRGLIKAITVPDSNYRWKLYTLVVTPYNLK